MKQVKKKVAKKASTKVSKKKTTKLTTKKSKKKKVTTTNGKNGNGDWKPGKGNISRFPKGVSGNPNGRPKGSKNKFSITELVQAIKSVEKKKKKGFMERWIELTWNDANAMSNVMNYMLPKLRATEGTLTTFETSMSDEDSAAIRKKLAKQWKNGSGV